MKIEITGEFIKLGQLLKKQNFIISGGAAKKFISMHEVKINDKFAEGRGSKIRPGDIIWIDDEVYQIVLKV